MSTPQARAASAGDRELARRWRSEPAPLLPLLHAFHDRDGYLSDEALRVVSDELEIPLADLYGTVTFYHHFARVPGGKARPRVCDGPICQLHGAHELLDELAGEGASPMPCAGRCDEPVPVIRGDEYLLGRPGKGLSAAPPPMPPAYLGGSGECCFAEIRSPGRASFGGYRATGGYRALARALSEMTPLELIDEIDQSGLAGRGGAGFPTGRKWRAVAEAPGEPKTIVCNADEGEPGCFKDRVLLDYDPHAVIEGMLLAGYATGASRGFIYLRYEYPHTQAILEGALAEARADGLLGARIRGTGFFLRALRAARRGGLYLRRGDVAPEQPRGQASVPAQPAAVPRDARVRGQADGGQQRRDALLGAADHCTRAGRA